jgi:hypothetical protein
VLYFGFVSFLLLFMFVSFHSSSLVSDIISFFGLCFFLVSLIFPYWFIYAFPWLFIFSCFLSFFNKNLWIFFRSFFMRSRERELSVQPDETFECQQRDVRHLLITSDTPVSKQTEVSSWFSENRWHTDRSDMAVCWGNVLWFMSWVWQTCRRASSSLKIFWPFSIVTG